MDIESIILQEKKPLSDDDIKHILGSDCKILEYKDLLKYRNINEILSKDRDYFVLLYELKASSGHWTTVLKYNNTLEHFDPYGIKPDGELNWIGASIRKRLHEQFPYLSKLFNESNMNVIYNHTRFQSYNTVISTCGAHVAHRIYRFIHNNFDLDDYTNYMNHIRNEYKLSYDEVVSEFVLSFQL